MNPKLIQYDNLSDAYGHCLRCDQCYKRLPRVYYKLVNVETDARFCSGQCAEEWVQEQADWEDCH